MLECSRKMAPHIMALTTPFVINIDGKIISSLSTLFVPGNICHTYACKTTIMMCMKLRRFVMCYDVTGNIS